MRHPTRAHLSDEEIRGAVTREIARDGRIHRFDVVRVQVDHGAVLLSGDVSSNAEKHAADDAAHRVPGVTVVLNRLTVAVHGKQ